MHFTADLSQLPLSQRQSIVKSLQREDAAQMALAKVRQAKIAQMYRDAVAPGTTKQGIGPVGLAVDPYWVSYFRRMHGDKIFQDDQFVEFLKKRGEWFHVPETGTKIQVGYSAPSNSRFRKTYGRNV